MGVWSDLMMRHRRAIPPTLAEWREIKAIGNRIRCIRENSGLSVEQLHVKSRISRVYWYEIERGTINVPIGTLMKMTRVLGVGLLDLVYVGRAKPGRKAA